MALKLAKPHLKSRSGSDLSSERMEFACVDHTPRVRIDDVVTESLEHSPRSEKLTILASDGSRYSAKGRLKNVACGLFQLVPKPLVTRAAHQGQLHRGRRSPALEVTYKDGFIQRDRLNRRHVLVGVQPLQFVSCPMWKDIFDGHICARTAKHAVAAPLLTHGLTLEGDGRETEGPAHPGNRQGPDDPGTDAR